MCAIQTRAMTCVNLFQHVDLSKHHIHIVYIAPQPKLWPWPTHLHLIFVVVEGVQVLLFFELNNFIKVELISKERGACSYWFQCLKPRKITLVLKIQDFFLKSKQILRRIQD